MIYVERSAETADLPVYVKATVKAQNGAMISKYERERESAIAYFTDPSHYLNDVKLTEDKGFRFSVFKDKALASILEKDFRKKCAYCESHFAKVTTADIEHYRPKASVGIGTGELKPGYYWMAGDWENLLLACLRCNRLNTYEVPGQSKGITLGKGTQFPLSDETRRVRKHEDDLAAENGFRLLLHPCVDRPDDHLLFEATTGLVRPRLDGAAGEMGKVSIDAYALQRKDLVEARRDQTNTLRERVDDLQSRVRTHNEYVAIGPVVDHLRQENLERIERLLAEIRSLMLPTAEHLAPKRHWIREADGQGEFATLRQFGIDLSDLLPQT